LKEDDINDYNKVSFISSLNKQLKEKNEYIKVLEKRLDFYMLNKNNADVKIPTIINVSTHSNTPTPMEKKKKLLVSNVSKQNIEIINSDIETHDNITIIEDKKLCQQNNGTDPVNNQIELLNDPDKKSVDVSTNNKPPKTARKKNILVVTNVSKQNTETISSSEHVEDIEIHDDIAKIKEEEELCQTNDVTDSIDEPTKLTNDQIFIDYDIKTKVYFLNTETNEIFKKNPNGTKGKQLGFINEKGKFKKCDDVVTSSS
jgi:hypothetical protein